MSNFRPHYNNKNNPVTIDTNISYINPYNFITLNKTGCKRFNASANHNGYTGYLNCELVTKTETIVPNAIGIDNTFPTYEFFNYQEQRNGFKIPVIPGSELRGMLRGDFEVFTDSCMSTIDKEKSFISRTKKAKIPGILKKDENGNWHLYKATRYALHTARRKEGFPRERQGNKEAIYLVDENNNVIVKGKKYQTGDKVKFVGISRMEFIRGKQLATNNVLEISETGNLSGLILIGELGGNKKGNNIHDSIFVCHEEVPNITGLNQSVKQLKDIIDMYNDKAFNKNLGNKRGWYLGYDVDNLKEIPTWYSINLDDERNNRVYLSPAAIGKEAYHRLLKDLLNVSNDEAKSYMPCIDKTCICEACDVFGFTTQEEAKGGKIRITDAIYEDEKNPYSNLRIIKELSSPHIANTAFYSLFLTNEQLANMLIDWNYDYKIENGEMIPILKDKITIRGRKMYWHHFPNENSKTSTKTVRNCAIIPIKEGIKFKFKIYFEDISDKELRDLIAVINLNYQSDFNYQNKPYYDLCHKIGKAKPFGYGSVKIEVKDVKIRKIELIGNKVSYNLIDFPESIPDITLNKRFDSSTSSFKDALRMYNFNYLKINYPNSLITYPLGQPSGKEAAGHYWFTYNKSSSFKDNYLLMVLPQIKDGKEIAENYDGLKLNVKKGNTTINIDGLNLPKYNK